MKKYRKEKKEDIRKNQLIRNRRYYQNHKDEIAIKRKEKRLKFQEKFGFDYAGRHCWVTRNKPKQELCTICHQTKPLELANISGEYLKDIDDYIWMCHECHSTFDGVNPFEGR